MWLKSACLKFSVIQTCNTQFWPRTVLRWSCPDKLHFQSDLNGTLHYLFAPKAPQLSANLSWGFGTARKWYEMAVLCQSPFIYKPIPRNRRVINPYLYQKQYPVTISSICVRCGNRYFMGNDWKRSLVCQMTPPTTPPGNLIRCHKNEEMLEFLHYQSKVYIYVFILHWYSWPNYRKILKSWKW